MSLKQIISKYMYFATGILVMVMMVVLFIYQMKSEQHRAYESATKSIMQFKQIFEENKRELEEIEAEYKETCLHNAETVARIIESDMSVLEDINVLKSIAESVEIDEIHIFDKTGKIYAGTHPEYYGYNFESGEQIGFFKPLLQDKSLALVQDIAPNTAAGKSMQYSALWSNNREFIVQVGVEPVNVFKLREKNTLSYIFSLVKVNPEADYYAIDAATGEVLGATVLDSVGLNVADIGFNFDEIKNDNDGFHEQVNGRHAFCVFDKIDDIYMGRVVTSINLYQRIPRSMVILAVCHVIIAFVLAKAVVMNMDKYVVKEISEVNEKLEAIAGGNFDETIGFDNSVEFAELSDHINSMTKSLSDNNKRMSYVLKKTNLYIGTYEYEYQGNKLRITEQVPAILSLEEAESENWSDCKDRFVEAIEAIRRNLVEDTEGVYHNNGKYVRIEEITDELGVFGVVIDVTSEMLKRREIETERDEDLLTRLYNRRGLENRLEKLFLEPDDLGYYAMIMIDADGLKGINDTYGHEKGDLYLKKIGGIINNFGIQESVASRQGGDEFVLFLYDYNSEEELLRTIQTLQYIQDNSTMHLMENVNIPIKFSMGYCISKGAADYLELIKVADEKMYQNKTKRRNM